MRDALASLPGVEKGSIRVSADDKLAVFKVTDPANFDAKQAVRKIETDTRFKATVAKTGSARSTE